MDTLTFALLRVLIAHYCDGGDILREVNLLSLIQGDAPDLRECNNEEWAEVGRLVKAVLDGRDAFDLLFPAVDGIEALSDWERRLHDNIWGDVDRFRAHAEYRFVWAVRERMQGHREDVPDVPA